MHDEDGHVARGPNWGNPRIFCGSEAEWSKLAAGLPAAYGLDNAGPRPADPVSRAIKSNLAAARDATYANGQTPVLPKDMAVAQAMAGEVLSHPVAGPLFAGDGMAEHSLFWDDEATGVRLRARPDWITEDGGIIVDYKTSVTANPAALERKWCDLAYHQQHAWYVDGFAAATGAQPPGFLFVAQEKEPPYLVSVLVYDDDAVTEGRRLNRLAIDTYVRCMDTDAWPAYADAITRLSLPYWATRDAINSDAAALIAELEGITA
jgi:hypothetical protein